MASDLFSIDSEFDRNRHVRFLDMMYDLLPSDYQSQEINHLTLAYFILSSLDILGSLDQVDKEAIVAWVLSFQAHRRNQDEPISGKLYGFYGSRSLQFPADVHRNLKHNGSHLASTYSALAILKIIGYDFSLFDSESIVRSMKNLQQPDGRYLEDHSLVDLLGVSSNAIVHQFLCFMPIHIGAEADLRFVYCAAAISYLLDDWNGVDKEKAKEYILSCQSYDGGFGLCPGLESHGGATYCAVASLRLMGYIEDDLLSEGVSSSIINIAMLLDWMMQRQTADGGFHGRPNKPSDTCYGFWVGGVLKILGGSRFADREAMRDSLLTCQSVYGGFSKFPGDLPELYHSYYGLSAYSLLEEDNLNSICVELGITNRAAYGS